MTFEERLRAEVDRAVAPYENVAPPAVLRKMRELAERYFREHPQASRILQILDEKQQQKSGTRATRHDDDKPAAATRTKKV
jgi:hypothetical protein